MKLRDTLLGLLVLGLVGAGVFWARARNRPRESGPADAAPARRAVGVATEAPLPDATLADASVDLGDARIVLSADRPVVAFAKARFRVRAEKGGLAVPIGDGSLSFQMKMPMGDHRYALVGGEDGWHVAEVVLPLCGSGDRTWFATVEGNVGGSPRTARFRLDLAPPAAGPTPVTSAR